jgi:hypothetical protein
MLLIAVCPPLTTPQVIVAAVGAVVGDVLLQPLNASAAGVFTVRLTLVLAALPLFGVAVSVPL